MRKRQRDKEEVMQMLTDRAARFLTALDDVLPPTLKVTKAMWQVSKVSLGTTTLVLLIPSAQHSWEANLEVIHKHMTRVLDKIEPPIVEFNAGNVTCVCSEWDFNEYEVYCPVR